MKEAKKELGKALFNLANMLLVLYLLGYYLQQKINFFVIFMIIYAIGSLIGFALSKEGSDE